MWMATLGWYRSPMAIRARTTNQSHRSTGIGALPTRHSTRWLVNRIEGCLCSRRARCLVPIAFIEKQVLWICFWRGKDWEERIIASRQVSELSKLRCETIHTWRIMYFIFRGWNFALLTHSNTPTKNKSACAHGLKSLHQTSRINVKQRCPNDHHCSWKLDFDS